MSRKARTITLKDLNLYLNSRLVEVEAAIDMANGMHSSKPIDYFVGQSDEIRALLYLVNKEEPQ